MRAPACLRAWAINVAGAGRRAAGFLIQKINIVCIRTSLACLVVVGGSKRNVALGLPILDFLFSGWVLATFKCQGILFSDITIYLTDSYASVVTRAFIFDNDFPTIFHCGNQSNSYICLFESVFAKYISSWNTVLFYFHGASLNTFN